jgi:Flp pilus assembly pilin Flp
MAQARAGAQRKGQGTVEYALIVAAVAVAVAAMGVYVQRAMQANFKQMEESVNESVQ